MKALISKFVLFAAAMPGIAQTPAGKPASPVAEAAAA